MAYVLKPTYTLIYCYVNVRSASVNLLKSVKIGGKRYKVKYIDFKKVHCNGDYQGHIHYDDQTIEIDKTKTKTTQECIQLHEILHGICHEYRINMKEDDINRLESGLYQVLKDNKLF